MIAWGEDKQIYWIKKGLFLQVYPAIHEGSQYKLTISGHVVDATKPITDKSEFKIRTALDRIHGNFRNEFLYLNDETASKGELFEIFDRIKQDASDYLISPMQKMAALLEQIA